MPAIKRIQTTPIDIPYVDTEMSSILFISLPPQEIFEEDKLETLDVPLLPNNDAAPPYSDSAIPNSDSALPLTQKEELSIPKMQAVWLLLKSSLPTMVQSFTMNISFLLTVYYVTLRVDDPDVLGSTGFGITFYFVGVVSVMQALSMGLSILGSQAMGAKDPYLLGVYFKRCLVIQIILCIPLAVMAFQVARIFRLVGFDANLAHNIQAVMLAMMPAILPSLYFNSARNYLSSQKIFAPQGYIQFVTFLLDISFQYLIIVTLNMSILGIGISRFVNDCIRAISIYVYIKCSKKCRESDVPWDRSCFQGLWQQFVFQFGAGGLQLIDLLGSEIILVQSGYFAAPILAASVIINRISKLAWVFPISIGAALSLFVGMSMGEQNIKKVRTFIKMGIITDFIIILCTWVVLGTQSVNIGRMFSSDATVIEFTSGLILFYLTIVPFDNYQNVLGGILRSSGKEKQTTILYLVTYYPIAIPLSIFLSHYTKLGIYGLYVAMLIAKSINTLVSIYLIWAMNLREQMNFIIKRIQDNKLKILEAAKKIHGYTKTTNAL